MGSSPPAGVPTFSPATYTHLHGHSSYLGNPTLPQTQTPAGLQYLHPVPIDPSLTPGAHAPMPLQPPVAQLQALVDSDSEGQNHTKLQTKKKTRDFAEVVGAKFGFMADLFRDFGYTIAVGQEHDAQTPAVHLNSRDQKYHDLWKTLRKYHPDISKDIIAGGAMGATQMSHTLEQGRRKLRQAMVDSIKRHIRDWYAFTPPLVPGRRDQQGFKHNDCGCLICPADYPWDNDEQVCAALRTHKSCKYPIEPCHLPLMLWANEEYDPDNLVKGFGRNILIVKAMLLFLRGPAAANSVNRDTDEHGSAGAASGTSNTKPHWSTWGITEITPPCIAACATMVRFALSDERSFSAGPSESAKSTRSARAGTWPYLRFYHHIVRFIEKTMSTAQREDLLSWYSTKVLGSSMYDNSVVDSDGDSGNDENHGDNGGAPRMSMLARLSAQARATARQ
ncbi:hypothetical protein BC835DRAFT_1422595 [Cytidiella melzeri]|nr:hypothetical protein BC835DRAFT_1422595 [Cytidiella melzeri]